MTADFEYDVAFSFHSIDEGLATQLNDLLQDRFQTFLYSRRQEVLAGSDGEQTFNAVFGEKTRCVVVFYRKEWGETPFTRIEQTAIRNRGYAEGYEFTLFIPTDDPPTTPPWLPRTRLYFGLSKFGLQGAAAVIEKRIQELGGEPTVETLQDRAARLQRGRDLKAAQKRFRESPEGVQRANEAFLSMVATLQAHAKEMADANPALAHLRVQKHDDYWLILGLPICGVLNWHVRFSNSLDQSVLRADTYNGVPRLPGIIPGFEEPRRISRTEFDYELVAVDRYSFVERTSTKRVFPPEGLAEHLLRAYMDAGERQGRH